MASHGTKQAHPSMMDLMKNAGILLVLMILTVVAYKVDFGHEVAKIVPVPNKEEFGSYFNNIVAVTIAMIKAYFVIQIFMGVKYSSQLTKMYAWMGFVWFPLMLMVFGDYTTRHWENVAGWNYGTNDTSAFRSEVDLAEQRLHKENATPHESEGGGH